MAIVSITSLDNFQILKANENDPLQYAVLYFSPSGTYAQADNLKLVAVPTLIQNGRRNGKTVTMVAGTLALWQPARKASDPDVFLAVKTLAISTNDITMELTLSATAKAIDVATEFTDATAIPALSIPLAILVGFTEA
jgi:hypothetical protein